MLMPVLLFLSISYSTPGFSSCHADLDKLTEGKSAVLVEIVELQDLDKSRQVAELKKSDAMVNISMPAKVKVLKVYKGSAKLADITEATVRLQCTGDGYEGVTSTVGPFDCRSLAGGSYPFIEGQRLLHFTHEGLETFDLSEGQACNYDLTWCVESGTGAERCSKLEDLEARLSRYWEK
jgi:hypothetical protein